MKNDELTVIVNYLDSETVKALNKFLRDTKYGNFTLIIKNSKVVGYDFLIRKRNKE
ncbi:MAG: hypothetical protein A4E56_00667 [Pelotomaculum sp. PtaU1.Bin065]|nr:MAG: hypothetical protein A4E56_00667 [Pelotomaculum sp. PtaU1.Bin065]